MAFGALAPISVPVGCMAKAGQAACRQTMGRNAMEGYLVQYLPILVFLGVAVGLALVIILASMLVAR